MKRWWILAMVVAVMVLPVSLGEARHRRVADSYTVSALPWPWPEDRRPDRCGTERITRDTHPFKAPFRGELSITMRFDGNWDLYVTDAEGRWIDSGRTGEFSPSPIQPNHEEISLFLRRNEKIHIVACNVMGGDEAEVEYELVHARKREGSAPSLRIVRKASYFGPGGIGVLSGGLCDAPETGCARFIRPEGSNRVAVRIRDELSGAVAGEIRQFGPQSRFRHRFEFCGAGKVRILPGVERVMVLVKDGVCADEPAVPTQGRIKVVFS